MRKGQQGPRPSQSWGGRQSAAEGGGLGCAERQGEAAPRGSKAVLRMACRLKLSLATAAREAEEKSARRSVRLIDRQPTQSVHR